MAIKKQEFYEGAALYLLALSGKITSIQIDSPFFLINETLLINLKYSTKSRSPWSFTFLPEEQLLLQEHSFTNKIVIDLPPNIWTPRKEWNTFQRGGTTWEKENRDDGMTAPSKKERFGW